MNDLSEEDGAVNNGKEAESTQSCGSLFGKGVGGEEWVGTLLKKSEDMQGSMG